MREEPITEELVVYAVEADRHGVKELEMPFYFERADAQRVVDERKHLLSWPRRVVAVTVK